MTQERLIDGVFPDRWVRPESPEGIADAVRGAGLHGEWVIPVGGGTAQNAANPVDAIPVALDTTGLTGIRDFEPTDLTVSVASGTRWTDLQAALREHGQQIPIDVPFPDLATVGGVVATGYAGPRRLRDGTLKDLLLGASFVRGDALAAKAGGMVVKNVTGFEIPRLLHGSWGSLAVITSVNLKVIPRPEFELTLLADDLDMLEAAEHVLRLTRARSTIAAATVDGTVERAAVAVRLTGREQPTLELAREVRSAASLRWQEDQIDGEASGEWWQARENRLAAGGSRVSIEVGCRPSDAVETLRKLRRALPVVKSLQVHASPGAGAIDLAFDAEALALGTWTRIWIEHGFDSTARFAIGFAPRSWRAEQDVWFIPEPQRKLMAALKAAFDPQDVLIRGRLWTAAPITQL
ncbi:MAG: FAD-binding oxidoreductase [Chloroflexota bacterium]|nr:FAD-binding oxidoreductase [Chloroflexota bacterium]